MKKNLLLAGLLGLLLTATWLLSEKKIFQQQNPGESVLQTALKEAQTIQLPHVQLALEDGVWSTASGEVVRGELMGELRRDLNALRVARTLTSTSLKNRDQEFFSHPVPFALGPTHFVLGDLSPSGDSFYFALEKSLDVYVVDLTAMGSSAVTDQENLLQMAKYQRLKDLLTLAERAWFDRRLVALARLGDFSRWQSGNLSLDAHALGQKSWGPPLVQAMQAGLLSLQVKGEIRQTQPTQRAALADWVFTKERGEERWEFFQHETLPVLSVWIAERGKSYPLDEESSDFVRRFPATLINRPFKLRLAPAGSHLDFIEGSKRASSAPEAFDPVQLGAFSEFFTTPQSFERAQILAVGDCAAMAKGVPYQILVGDEIWHPFRVKGALVFLECGSGVALSWSLPLESTLDFASLRKP